ncbi:hypothetical protein PCANC_06646 [Puccinia coronata f. sp. avenae]|uniref:Uncharacterized protein n=1 Tax=Puccinia coronata f. sp. avenae TaxID=200324 RepID=A0A2N5T033_9BASI|nr:hypothetical protein PCANC_06646 [Puccinia coronata f. sp. avenae]PLW33703.1 hypothetical protein PCASD_10314 [Puccinia coronata f. sp. avenae]
MFNPYEYGHQQNPSNPYEYGHQQTPYVQQPPANHHSRPSAFIPGSPEGSRPEIRPNDHNAMNHPNAPYGNHCSQLHGVADNRNSLASSTHTRHQLILQHDQIYHDPLPTQQHSPSLHSINHALQSSHNAGLNHQSNYSTPHGAPVNSVYLGTPTGHCSISTSPNQYAPTASTHALPHHSPQRPVQMKSIPNTALFRQVIVAKPLPNLAVELKGAMEPQETPVATKKPTAKKKPAAKKKPPKASNASKSAKNQQSAAEATQSQQYVGKGATSGSTSRNEGGGKSGTSKKKKPPKQPVLIPQQPTLTSTAPLLDIEVDLRGLNEILSPPNRSLTLDPKNFPWIEEEDQPCIEEDNQYITANHANKTTDHGRNQIEEALLGDTELNQSIPTDEEEGPVLPRNVDTSVPADDTQEENASKSAHQGNTKPPKRRKLSPHLIARLDSMELEELRERARHNGFYSRLVAKDKVELDDVYEEYQKALYKPCSTGGRTDTVRPKREPTGRTDLSDRSRLVLCNRSQELIGQACPTRRQMLRSDSACPTTGRTRLFEHRSNCRVRPVNAGSEGNQSRVSTMYNNFCQYDEGAKKIKADKSVTVQQRSSKCGVLWRSLDKQTQAKFKDAEFLSTLPNPFLDNTEDPIMESGLADNHATESAPVYGRKALASRTQKGRKVARPSSFDAVCWGSKIKTDLTHLANSHLVEGFIILVYPHKKGRAVLTGGSPMGERFMDMFPNDANPTNDFLDFVKGHIALSNVLGREAPLPTKTRKTIKDTVAPCPHYKGSLEKNIDAVREQLGYAIYKASGGAWLNGWPGANTLKQMEKLKLAIRIKPNNKQLHVKDVCKRPSDLGIGQSNQILTALANGWIELVSTNPENVEHSGDTSVQGTIGASHVVVAGPVPPGESVPEKGKKKANPKKAKSKKAKPISTKTKKTDRSTRTHPTTKSGQKPTKRQHRKNVNDEDKMTSSSDTSDSGESWEQSESEDSSSEEDQSANDSDGNSAKDHVPVAKPNKKRQRILAPKLKRRKEDKSSKEHEPVGSDDNDTEADCPVNGNGEGSSRPSKRQCTTATDSSRQSQ